ncbi:putative reverse transcriptase domain-containing protein [Tanacetum coccineum]
MLLSEYHNDVCLAMLTVGFSNAFNLVDISALLHEVRVSCPSISLWVDFLYGQAARLYMGDTHIWSTTGVQQGDPLGPLLFALVLHPLVHKIRDSCKLLLHAWYLDDGTVIGDSEEVARVLDIIKVSGPGLSLELNIKKTEIFWPSFNGAKLREGLFPVDIRRPSLGVKLLGESCLCGSIENIVVCGGPFFRDLQWQLASLPIRLGGLGLYSAKEASFYAFVASRAQSWVLQDHILRGNGLCGMDDDYVSTLACLRDTIPSFDFSYFLLAILIDRLGQHMSPVKSRIILKRVGISAKKEAPVKFLTNPSDRISTLRPADVLVFGWVRGKHACVDLTGVSPLVGLRGIFEFYIGMLLGAILGRSKACRYVVDYERPFCKSYLDSNAFLLMRPSTQAMKSAKHLRSTKRIAKAKLEAARYQKLLASRFKEQRRK